MIEPDNAARAAENSDAQPSAAQNAAMGIPTTVFSFIGGLAVLYGIGRLITPWATLFMLILTLITAISPKKTAEHPRIALPPSLVRRISLLAALAMLLIGFSQILQSGPADEQSKAQLTEASAAGVTAEEAAAIRKKNLSEIQKIEADLKVLPASAVDWNNDLYAKLTELDPGNAAYAAKSAHYREAAEKLQDLRDHPDQALELTKSAWVRSTGFGNIPVMAFTIHNNAPWIIRDPVVTCHFYGGSGTQINALDKTIYEAIDGGQTRTFKNQMMGFIKGDDTKTVHCEISAANQ